MDAAIFSIVAAISGWYLLRWMRSNPIPNSPVQRVEFDDGDNSRLRYARESEKLIAKGYRDYLRKGQAFSMRNVVDDRRPLVVLPRKYLDEVKNASQDELSFPRFMEDLSILRHVGGPLITDELCHATRTDLNRALPHLIQQLYEDCLTGCKEFIPECPEWTSIMPYPLLLQIFNRIGQRVLVGPELGRNPEWLDLTQNYTTSLLQGTNTVRAKYTPSLRWLAKYLERDVKMVYKQRQRAAALLEPVLQSRLAARAEKQQQTDHHDDAIEWLIDDYHRKGMQVTAQEIAQDQLGLTLAAIHNTAATVLSTLYDLIDHPASLDDIRTEVRQAMGQHGGGFDRAALQSLRHLDSFMTESLRMHSMPQVTVQRLALVPKTFHDGFHIPAGTQVMFANRQLNHDLDLYPDPERFDAKRFYDRDGNNKHHFATVSDDFINFGSGFHACPGRFFAQDVIKLLLASLLIRYDFKYLEKGQKRPADMTDNLVVYPDVTVPILIKELSL
ncbi:cytochrome P450 [Apiospora marii]|uniref:Cytochrome P450 n=1 Tax=Apiospora marii TaxID=335849 RepID=A0ABR1SHK3_9PEZI